MTYQTVPTVTTGEMWTADQHNTYVRNNFASLWPYTTNGDIAYANTTSSLQRLPVGSEGQILSVASGLPSWIDQTQKYCVLKRAATQNISINTRTSVSFDTESFDNFGFFDIASPTVINLPEAGLYRIDGYIRYTSNASGIRAFILYDNPNVNYIDTRLAVNSGFTISNGSFVYQVASPTTINLQAFQTGSSILTFYANVSITYIGAV